MRTTEFNALAALPLEIEHSRQELENIQAQRSQYDAGTDAAAALDELAAINTRTIERDQEKLDRLTGIIKAAPGHIRQALTLRYVYGLTWARVALKLNTTAGAIKRACARYLAPL